jgi:NAD+ synthase (glutamine-hydrolysing)
MITRPSPFPLPSFLQAKLDDLRSKKAFNINEWIDNKTDKLNQYMIDNGLSACVIAVSGGIDSSVTFKLAQYAMKKANSPIKKVVGISIPIASTETIWTRALDLDENISVIDQSKYFHNLVNDISGLSLGNPDDTKRKFADGQLKSYMRTPINYYVAQLLSSAGFPAIVLGTGNKDEDRYLAYFCKAGDGVVDVQLISDLHKSEVFKVGEKLNIPCNILSAPPSADLWEGQTDEDELGFSYDFVELLLIYQDMTDDEREDFQTCCTNNDISNWNYFLANKAKAENVHNRNKHKLNFPINL